MRKVRTKSLPLNCIEVDPAIYRRIQAMAIDSHRSESELLEMAIRLLCTAISRMDNFKIPGRTPTPKPKSKRTPVAPIGATVKRTLDKIRSAKP